MKCRVLLLAVGSAAASFCAYKILRLVWTEAAAVIHARGGDMRTIVVSRIVERCATETLNNDVRRQFHMMELAQVKPTPGHSHGQSAAARTSAAITIDHFAETLNRPVYTVSLCSRDTDAPLAYHQYYLAKDAVTAPRCDKVPPNAIIKMVDVDYYVDLSHWLMYRCPIVMYTFTPNVVAYHSKEYSYGLSTTGVRMSVSGGARVYEHQLWDYSHDYIYVRVPWWRHMLCSVDIRRVDEHHSMVLINPIRVFRYVGFLLQGPTLTRLRFGHGEYVQNRYRTDNGVMVSFGRAVDGHAEVSAEIDIAQLEAIRIRVGNAKHPQISDVERILREGETPGDGKSTAARTAPIIYQAIKDQMALATPILHAPGSFPVRRFQAIAPLTYEDGVEIGRAVCPSLVVNPDVVPNRSYNNDYASVTGRVLRVLNHQVPNIRYRNFAQEFVDRVVVVKHRGIPYTVDEVIEFQARPTQRGRSTQAEHWISACNAVSVRAFMKGESYAKPSDPRNISTVGTNHMLTLSGYTYAFKRDVLYPKGWYAPAKPPKVIAERIVDLASRYILFETDYSRFDGTISRWLRENVERACYAAWVAPEYKEHLDAYLRAEYDPRAVTSNGVAYRPRYSRLSGSPLTTDGNTLINAFVSYMAARFARMEPDDAFASLGLYGGDDGLSVVDGRQLQQAADVLGLKLKCERRTRQVTFLGRVFLDPASGVTGSLQDPLRTWRKLHYSFSNQVPLMQALANRAYGYLSLDPTAPVVSTWAHRMLELSGLPGYIDDADTPYYVQVAAMEPGFGGWPQLTYSQGLEAISWRLDVDAATIADLDERIRLISNINGIEHLWGNEVAKPMLDVVVDGQIQLARVEETRTQRQDTKPRKERPLSAKTRNRKRAPVQRRDVKPTSASGNVAKTGVTPVRLPRSKESKGLGQAHTRNRKMIAGADLTPRTRL